MTRASRALAAFGLVVVLGACSGSSHSATNAAGGAQEKPTTLVTIGSSATEGDGVADRFREAWPYLLFDEAFPVSTSLVNAAVDGATVANAPAQQLPLVREVKPEVVAIWLGVDDLQEHTPTGQFSSGLRTLIADLHSDGVTRILIADIPNAFGTSASSYDNAIRAVVRSTEVSLVELQNTAISLVPSRGLSNQPDAAGQRLIATAFERALRAKS